MRNEKLSMAKEAYKKVKFTPYRPGLGTILHRQTAGGKLLSRDQRYRFYVDEPVDDPDFWVVQGKGLRRPETVSVARGHTVFLATEPRSVLVYPRKYLRQFGHVCTCQEQTRHPNVHLGPAVLPWFVGFTKDAQGNYAYTLDYDTLIASPPPPKTRLISVITSNKAFTKGHVDRIRFVERLQQHYGSRLEVFGRGFRPFDDKWDVLAPYAYHIAIENSSEPYYWTEKISDCFLASAFPFYYGCTRLADYFPADSFIPIDIHQPDQAIALIDQAISTDRAALAADAVAESRRRVLQDYNLFEAVARLCDQILAAEKPREEAAQAPLTLQPCHSMDDWHNVWRYAVGRNFFKLKQKINGHHLVQP